MLLFNQHPYQQVVQYRVRVQGFLDQLWLNWFPGLEISIEKTGDEQVYSVITVQDADSARLRGILDRILDLNLILISVDRLQAGVNDNPPDKAGSEFFQGGRE